MLDRTGKSHETTDIVDFPCLPAVTSTVAVWAEPAAKRAAIFESLIHAVHSIAVPATRILEECNLEPKLIPWSVSIAAPVAGLFARIVRETSADNNALSNDRISVVEEIRSPSVIANLNDFPRPREF